MTKTRDEHDQNKTAFSIPARKISPRAGTAKKATNTVKLVHYPAKRCTMWQIITLAGIQAPLSAETIPGKALRAYRICAACPRREGAAPPRSKKSKG